ncbi:TetR/AcrR family transcriptional regulator [Niastella caeni]|nr:TetR/AcrR family transcriptional regulator [Niastella caeni]
MPKTKQFDENEVLMKAKELFSEKGYNGTSMDDLVQATGLSRSSIYDTFGDKHGLFLKSLNHYRNSQQGDMEKQCAKTDSPKKKIRSIFDYTIKNILSDKDRKGCLLINVSMELSAVDKEVAAVSLSNMEDMEQIFGSLVKEGQSKGEISKKFTPKALGRYLYSSLIGLRVTGMNRPDIDTLREIVKLALSILDVE